MLRKKLKTPSMVVINDTQLADNTPYEHILWTADFIWDEKPDYVLLIGDWFDNPALCKYTKGMLKAEGLRVLIDLKYGQKVMSEFINRLKQRKDEANAKAVRSHGRGASKKYWPKFIFVMGNHEERLMTYVQYHPELEEIFNYKTYGLEEHGFEIIPFEGHVIIENVVFSHYLTSNNSPSPINRAHLIMKDLNCSAVVGHTPGLDYAVSKKSPFGNILQCIVSGSFYTHEETYRRQICNGHWRGFLHLVNMRNGMFTPRFIDIDTLRGWYE